MPPTVITHNPTTGIEIGRYPAHSAEQIDRTLDRAQHARTAWRALPVVRRAAHLQAIARLLHQRRTELARLATTEMGKPVREAEAEIDKCAWVCEYYADTAAEVLEDEPVDTGRRSWIAHEPVGTVLAIMPWNFPFWQALRFAAPTLVAGNTAVLKHSPNVTGCALAIENLFANAGLPDGVFAAIVVAEPDVPAVVERLLADDRIDAVSLTGSDNAGSAVGALAGRMVKKSVLELGGSDPFVVLDDANLDAAVDAAIRSRFLNAGQSCLAAKRFIVHEQIAEPFITALAAGVRSLTVGDPSNPATAIGPLARADLLDLLATQVDKAVDAGAHLVTGGHRIPGPGTFYAPTVLTDLGPDSPVLVEETFGPVAAVVTVVDDDAAVAVADRTRYGLGASIWSADIDRALAIGRRITSGAVFVNSVVASDPRLPFGGTRRSGYGRELGATGLREFVNTRTWVVTDPMEGARP